MRNIKKILIAQETGQKFFVKDLDDDFHTSFGAIAKKDLQSDKELVKSNKNKTFTLLEPTFPDLWESLERGPQVMLPKDIGVIIAKTGINSKSRIVDAGGGSGSLCLSLANICKEITVYEINPEHFKILNKNKELFGLTNITLKNENINNGIAEKELDLITLDLPEPWRVIKFTEDSLKLGAYLVVYLPNLVQMQQFIESLHKSKIKIIEVIELLERRWRIESQIMRPEFQMLGHTGFLIFGRKL